MAVAADQAAWVPDRAEPRHVGDGWDRSGERPTKLITGRPDNGPRPLPMTPAARRRAPRTPAEFVGARPARIMAWAFALGLLLILIAISTADAPPRCACLADAAESARTPGVRRRTTSQRRPPTARDSGASTRPIPLENPAPSA